MSDNEHSTAADRAYIGKELFPIREVARLTGVNPVTLRAWERRYGLVQPTRTESGHRLYSLTDVAEVRAILGWLERGVAVSKVGTLIARNPAPVDASPMAYHKGDSDCRHWRDRITGAMQGFNEVTLARLYGEVFSTYPMATAFNEVFLPVWEKARLHQDAFGQASEWAFLDAFLRGQALKRLQFAQRETAEHHVLLCGIPGQYHELELLVAALLLGGEHVWVQPLGTGQPLEELGLVSERIQPHAVILFSNHSPGADAGRRFMKLGLNLNCPLLLAGEMSELIHDQLIHSPIACLGGNSQLMQRRLLQYIAGHLDT